jgi:5S rRNA maturation endonuclease (ribonuclease M5)
MGKPVFIVEGWSDAEQISKAFPDHEVNIIVTNGTKINNRLKSQINNHIEEGNTPYVLSDPDSAGDILSNMIRYFYPSIERIEANPDKCRYMRGKGKYKFGIEYASYRYLKDLLEEYLVGECK